MCSIHKALRRNSNGAGNFVPDIFGFCFIFIDKNDFLNFPFFFDFHSHS